MLKMQERPSVRHASDTGRPDRRAAGGPGRRSGKVRGGAVRTRNPKCPDPVISHPRLRSLPTPHRSVAAPPPIPAAARPSRRRLLPSAAVSSSQGPAAAGSDTMDAAPLLHGPPKGARYEAAPARASCLRSRFVSPLRKSTFKVMCNRHHVFSRLGKSVL